MLYVLIFLILVVFTYYLYQRSTVWEGWHNYNYRNHYQNLFNVFPYKTRSPYNYYNTFYSTGIYSVPHYNTHHDPSQSYLDHYAYHNYQSNLPLTGTLNKLGIISKPPLSLSNLLPGYN